MGNLLGTRIVGATRKTAQVQNGKMVAILCRRLRGGSVLNHAHVRGCLVYLLSGPLEGGIGPLQEPVSFETGVSWLGHHTVSSPFVRRTCTIISRDSQLRFHQYQRGCVGGAVVRGRGACDGLSFDVGVMRGRLSRPWAGVNASEGCGVIHGVRVRT